LLPDLRDHAEITYLQLKEFFVSVQQAVAQSRAYVWHKVKTPLILIVRVKLYATGFSRSFPDENRWILRFVFKVAGDLENSITYCPELQVTSI
jgi:hypothetical protein